MNIERALSIDGWMSEAELKFLANHAQTSRLIIEFGCWKGRSTRALADNTNGLIFAVDPWNGIYYADNDTVHGIRTDVFPEFETNLKDKIDARVVIPFRKYSEDFYTSWSPDFIFIDGDHRYETVKKDILLAMELLREGGVLAGHDYTHRDWPGVKKAVDEIFPNVNLVDSIWWIHVSKDYDSNTYNGNGKAS
jgi:predicted O-methyltransferase YrrM